MTTASIFHRQLLESQKTKVHKSVWQRLCLLDGSVLAVSFFFLLLSPPTTSLHAGLHVPGAWSGKVKSNKPPWLDRGSLWPRLTRSDWPRGGASGTRLRVFTLQCVWSWVFLYTYMRGRGPRSRFMWPTWCTVMRVVTAQFDSMFGVDGVGLQSYKLSRHSAVVTDSRGIFSY